MTQALYRKWRPQDWDEVAGQDHVTQTLRNAVINDRVAHAYLFAGPRGTGKTTSARLLAKSVNCLEPKLEKRPCNQCEHCKALTAGRFLDLIEIDAASNTSVDDVRDLRDKINFSPSQGKYKVYIIDEVHMLSTAAFNALLKTLEEPPPHAIFILATTEIHKIPATVLSRCQRHEFRRIPVDIIVNLLKAKSKEEDIRVEEAVFTEIARQATGSLRDAISLLDQLASTKENITLEMAQEVLGTATSLRVIEIIDALIAKDPASGLNQINQALDSGTDPRQLARQIVTYLRNILLHKMENKAQVKVADEVLPKVFEHASHLTLPDLLQAIEAFNTATEKEQANWHPGLGLELAFTAFLAKPAEQVSPTSLPESSPPQKSPRSEAPKADKPPLKGAQSKPAPQKITAEPEPIKPSSPAKREIPEKKDEIEAPIKVSEGEVSLNDVNQAWGRIKAMVGKHNARTEALLNSSKLTGLKDNTLMLGFTTDTLKEMMEKEGNINLTADILEEIFKCPIQVKCIVTSHQSGALPENLDIDHDGMVGTATRDLGGKITNAEEAD